MVIWVYRTVALIPLVMAVLAIARADGINAAIGGIGAIMFSHLADHAEESH